MLNSNLSNQERQELQELREISFEFTKMQRLSKWIGSFNSIKTALANEMTEQVISPSTFADLSYQLDKVTEAIAKIETVKNRSRSLIHYS